VVHYADESMNVFFEFHKIVQKLEAEGVRYAVVGGVAMAFHAYARFTRDIDILIANDGLTKIQEILEKEGYVHVSKPWQFKTTQLPLHCFMKVVDEEEMIVDVLIGETKRHTEIIEDALEAFSKGTGMVRVATKADLIWMKSQRGSTIDRADTEALEKRELLFSATSEAEPQTRRPLREERRPHRSALHRAACKLDAFSKAFHFQLLS
jgi:predicted nucleotidyltransferase